MGLFSFLSGKSPEEIESIGDRYFNAEEFGAAKVEYEKALEKARQKFPDKTDLIKSLSEKVKKTREQLALSHQKTAEHLIGSENFDEAEGLLQLALELTEDPGLKEELLASLKSLGKKAVKNVAYTQPSYEEPGTVAQQIEDRGEVKNIDEYFSVLCSALPEEIQDQYHEYGQNFKLGYVALNSGDFEAAAGYLEKAMNENLHPHSQVPLEFSTALVHLRRFDEAAEILLKFIHDNPDVSRGYQVLCEVFWDMQDFDRALELLETSPDRIKSSAAIQMLLGETLYLKGSYADALKLFKNAMDKFGFNEIIARSLAKTHEAIGEIKTARDLYGKIIQSCQSCRTRIDPFIKGRYADLCFQSGDRSSNLVEVYFSLVQEDADNKFHYYQRICKLYEEMGNVEQAQRYQALAEASAP